MHVKSLVGMNCGEHADDPERCRALGGRLAFSGGD
jgi:hypothetical protein